MILGSRVRPGLAPSSAARIGLVFAATLILLSGFVALARFVPVVHAASSSLAVYVGYADDTGELNGTMFSNPAYPFPWCGAANVTVEGDCQYVDGGAIMLVNTGSAALEVGNVLAYFPANSTMLVYSSVTFDGTVDIAPGQAVILDQGSSAYPFNPPSYDTSELGTLPPCSIPLVGGQFAPQVILGLGKANVTYIDANHVLDTGGSDLGACNGADETTQWQQVFRPGTPATTTSQSLQPVGGSYAAQPVAGTSWDFTNGNVCGRPGTAPQCETASIDLGGVTGLHMLDGGGNPIPFTGTAVSSGIALGGCQNTFKRLPNVKSNAAAIASCFDAAIVTTGTLVGNVSITPKVLLPASVAGPSCNLLSLQVSYLVGKAYKTDGSLKPSTYFGTSGGKVICGITVSQDASVLGTSALKAAGHTAFTVIEHTPTVATCSSPTPVGAWVSCKVTVSGNSASGKVAWTNDGTPGTFKTGTCSLAVGSKKSTCVDSYKQTTFSSPVALTAAYAGDTYNGANSNIFQLTVNQKASSTKLTCTPASLHANSVTPFTCTAKVTGFNPTGTVSFAVGFTGTQTCSLSSGSCHVQLFPAGAGKWKLTVTYAGDANNIGSVATKTLTVTT